VHVLYPGRSKLRPYKGYKAPTKAMKRAQRL
jgi:hypothetical protein